MGANRPGIHSLWIVVFAALIFSGPLPAQKNESANPDFATITARGRLLAEYDSAGWHSTDAVQELHPKEGSVNKYVARKTKAGWTVMYGRISNTWDKFLIVYEAVQGDTPEKFTVKEHNPPLEDTGYFLHAARANETVRSNYVNENRAYNVSVLPADGGKFWVYIIPAQLKEGTYPFGGDARYLISDDGWMILEKTQLHDAVEDQRDDAKDPTPPPSRHHTDTLSDIPVDTDVFYVLSRKPFLPEYVTAGKQKFLIKIDGTIQISK
ncbi:MAG TPA: hypothetical protein VNY09_08800 [Candidatus Sulfotelmatobacter sp.]|nr:hypothetical protein [Candidatus Sulfotelmatobacter sp.]